MGRTKIFFYYWLPVIVYGIFIFWLSSRIVYTNTDTIWFPHSDKIIHIGEYGILTFLVLRAIKINFTKLEAGEVCFFSVLISFAYGISDEVHQMYVPSRQLDILDLTANFLGAFVVGLIWWYKNK